MAEWRAHAGGSTVASFYYHGSSIERLRYLVSHSNCRFQVRAKPRCATSCAPFVRTSPPATRSSSREAGSSAAFPEPSSASERCSTMQQQPQHAVFEGENDCRGQAPHFPQPRQCRTPRSRTIARTYSEWTGPRLVAGEAVLWLFVALCGAPLACEQPPASTCSALVFESSRRHGARTPPGSVMPRCVHHAPARWGAEPSRTRSISAHGAIMAPPRFVNA